MTVALRNLGLRIIAVLLLASGFALYSAYGRSFYAGFLAECRNLPEANLDDASNGIPDIGWLYGFLIGVIPVMLTSRAGLRIIIGLFLFYDFIAGFSLLGPYPGSDCGIHTGNDQDFTGSYVAFQLGYALLLLIIYAVLVADVSGRGVQWLLRSIKK